jgi:hypothetical protein
LTPFSSVKKPKPKSEFNPSQMKKSDQMSETKQTSNEIIMQPIREISTVTAQNKRIIRFHIYRMDRRFIFVVLLFFCSSDELKRWLNIYQCTSPRWANALLRR